MSRSIWNTAVVKLGDYIKHLRQVDDESYKRAESGKSCESCLTCNGHYCDRHSERSCDCSGHDCADDDIGGDFYSTGSTVTFSKRGVIYQRTRIPKPNQYGNFRCPISGQLCSSSVCKEWCEGSGSSPEVGHDRRIAKAADYYRNIDNETGNAR